MGGISWGGDRSLGGFNSNLPCRGNTDRFRKMGSIAGRPTDSKFSEAAQTKMARAECMALVGNFAKKNLDVE